MRSNLSEPADALYRIKRGLAAYVSYLAACEMNQAFSEYVLYEPILRILTARGYRVSSEVECPGIHQPSRGDRKRLDFYAEGHGFKLAIEVKWARNKTPKVKSDLEKLEALARANADVLPLLCIFGRASHVSDLVPPSGFAECGKAAVADLGTTRFACRIFKLGASSKINRRTKTATVAS
jgi:hypothetical protein